MLTPIAPYFGYLASLFLILALVINNDLKFRWFNTMGNIAFIVYAVLLVALPVLLTNLILLGINIFYLVKIYRRKENFDMMEFTGDEKLPQKFIAFYHEDIAAYFPHFATDQLQGQFNFIVTRDLVIANIFSAVLTKDGDAYVQLNYTPKKFRDFKVGSYIFEKEREYLLSRGIRRIVYHTVPQKGHLQFLKVMGFKTETICNTACLVKYL